jgi:ATP-binding cassette subfamily B protein
MRWAIGGGTIAPLVPHAARILLVWMAFIGVLQAAGAVLIVNLVDLLFGKATSGDPVSPLLVAGFATTIFAISWLRYRERLDGERIGQAVSHEVRLRLASHLVRLPPITDRRSSGDVLLRFIGDMGALRNWYARGVVGLVVGLPVVVAGFGAIAWLDWRMALLIAAALTVASLVQFVIAKRLKRSGEAARRLRGRLASDVSERMDALSSVQIFGRSCAEARHIERRSKKLAGAMVERARWSGLLRAGTEWFVLAMPLVVLVIWASSTQADVGVGASVMAVGAILAARLRELGRVLEYHTLAEISRERIAEFLNRETLDERSSGKGLFRRDGHLKLKNVTLDGVFANLNAETRPGARIALTGPNGAGKSRLLGLIAGLEDPTSGTVVLDRQNIMLRRRRSLRKLVALATIETPLMRGTVDSNIGYGARAEEGEAAAILELGDYQGLVRELPDGGVTRLGPAGKGLSQGQKRRVLLLRALMRRPLVLLLDEVEAGMDAGGFAVLDRLFRDFDGVIVMATHSPDWQRRCDAVWHLESGLLSVEDTCASEEQEYGSHHR